MISSDYIILNERRSIGQSQDKVDEEYNRIRLWWAWINFIRSLSQLPPDPSKINAITPDINSNIAISGKPNSNSKGNYKIKVAKGYSASFNVSANHSTFEGISLHSYSESVPLDNDDGTSTENLNNQCYNYNIQQLLPLICFLDGWLEELKKSESNFDYLKKKTGENAIISIFKVAPYPKFYSENLKNVQSLITSLENIFTGNIKESDFPPGIYPYDKNPIHIAPDICYEEMWTIKRNNMSTWNLCWTYFSRSKVRKCSNRICLLTKKGGCDFVDFCTKIDNGSIAYLESEDLDGIKPNDNLKFWFERRKMTYIVSNSTTNNVNLTSWGNLTTNDTIIEGKQKKFINLLVPNNGKAGALNTCLEYVKNRVKDWVKSDNIVKIFFGVIDARHMLAEPEIFWNEALPFFTKDKNNNNIKDYGDNKDVILVQYPQFFCNVSNDDYLDNKNSGYYTLWQTLRDCSKTITSSGTNAIWDTTGNDFSFATTSRIEDTGTSQKYLSKYISVHIPCFVAHGVAKETGDYIEAVYRWSTGAVELFWASVFTSEMIRHYLIILAMSIIYAFACFTEGFYVYPTWLLFIVFIFLVIYYDKNNHKRPLRSIIVSAVVVTNTMYWISNLLSLVWVILIPTMITFYSKPPFTNSTSQTLAWALIAIFIRLPPAIMSDRLIAIVRKIGTKTDVLKTWNFNGVLWRSSQLYVCSFGYSLLSIISGSYTSLKAVLYGSDNTSWNSFKIPEESELKEMYNNINGINWKSLKSFFKYLCLILNPYIFAIAQPEIVTKWNAAGLLLFQIVCMAVSIGVTNVNSPTNIVITLIVCGLNIFLVTDIALLLVPMIDKTIGRPIRPEYAFACWVIITVIIIASKTAINYLPFKEMFER